MATNDRIPSDMVEDRVTKKKVNTAISEIDFSLLQKVDKNSVIATINSPLEMDKIASGKLSLNGMNIASGKFVVDESGTNVTFSGTLTSPGVTTPEFVITGKSETTVEHKTPITITKEIKSRDNTNSILTVANGLIRFNHDGEQYWYADKTGAGWTRFKIGNIFLKTDGTNAIEVRNNSDDGMAKIRALEFEIVSDRDYKKNIEELDVNAIEIMKTQMTVHEYNFVNESDDDETHIGLIAQEASPLVSDGKTVNLYAHSSLNTKAIQEIIERLEVVERALGLRGEN